MTILDFCHYYYLCDLYTCEMIYTQQAFCRMPLGTGGGVGFVASVATKEATRGSARCREGEASFLCCFEVEAAPLGSSPVIFFVELPTRVFTIFKSLDKEQKQKLTEKKMREKMRAFWLREANKRFMVRLHQV